jgi:acetolactate synthase regulatory subunit
MNHDLSPEMTEPDAARPGLCDQGAVALALAQSELTLPRLIWLVEQRGFRIERMDMVPQAEGFRVDMEVRARAPHYRLAVLERQIDRLVGVRRLPVDAASRLAGAAA